MEPKIDACFDHVDVVTDVLGELAGDRRSSDEKQIARAEAHIIVLHKGRPVSAKRIFQPTAQRPAAYGMARKGVKAAIKWCWIFISRMLPGIATEDIEERPIERGADAPGDCPNGFDSGHAGLRGTGGRY